MSHWNVFYTSVILVTSVSRKIVKWTCIMCGCQSYN